jgi:hypothetical protein
VENAGGNYQIWRINVTKKTQWPITHSQRSFVFQNGLRAGFELFTFCDS